MSASLQRPFFGGDDHATDDNEELHALNANGSASGFLMTGRAAFGDRDHNDGGGDDAYDDDSSGVSHSAAAGLGNYSLGTSHDLSAAELAKARDVRRQLLEFGCPDAEDISDAELLMLIVNDPDEFPDGLDTFDTGANTADTSSSNNNNATTTTTTNNNNTTTTTTNNNNNYNNSADATVEVSVYGDEKAAAEQSPARMGMPSAGFGTGADDAPTALPRYFAGADPVAGFEHLGGDGGGDAYTISGTGTVDEGVVAYANADAGAAAAVAFSQHTVSASLLFDEQRVEEEGNEDPFGEIGGDESAIAVEEEDDDAADDVDPSLLGLPAEQELFAQSTAARPATRHGSSGRHLDFASPAHTALAHGRARQQSAAASAPLRRGGRGAGASAASASPNVSMNTTARFLRRSAGKLGGGARRVRMKNDDEDDDDDDDGDIHGDADGSGGGGAGVYSSGEEQQAQAAAAAAGHGDVRAHAHPSPAVPHAHLFGRTSHHNAHAGAASAAAADGFAGTSTPEDKTRGGPALRRAAAAGGGGGRAGGGSGPRASPDMDRIVRVAAAAPGGGADDARGAFATPTDNHYGAGGRGTGGRSRVIQGRALRYTVEDEEPLDKQSHFAVGEESEGGLSRSSRPPMYHASPPCKNRSFLCAPSTVLTEETRKKRTYVVKRNPRATFKKTDPVARFHAMNKTWGRDAFLRGSARRAKTKTAVAVVAGGAAGSPSGSPAPKRAMGSARKPKGAHDSSAFGYGFKSPLRNFSSTPHRRQRPIRVNDYVVPTDKKRDQLRWDVRARLMNVS